MTKNRKTILGVILCTLMALCLSVGAFGLTQRTETAHASGGTISTIGDVLNTVEGGFPTTKETGWYNENRQMYCYYNSGKFCIADNEQIWVNDDVSTNLTKSQDDYSYSGLNSIYTVTFTTENGVLTKISIISSFPATNIHGDYIVQSITIANIKPDNFPNSESSYWMNENLEQIYLADENDGLCFNNLGSLVSHFPNEKATKNNDNNYVYTFTYNEDNIKVELIMNDDTFNALKVSGFTGNNATKNGTYTAPVTLGNIIGDFVDSTNAWKNGSNKAYKEVGAETELFIENQSKTAHIELTKSVVKISDAQYKYTDSYYGYNVTFNLENNVLTCITFSDDGDFSSLNGTYYPQPKKNDTFTANGIYYVVTFVGDTNTVKVGDNTSFEGTSVTIPATVNYKGVAFDVTEIASTAFCSCSQLESVTFEEGIALTTIGASAFDGSGLLEIELPASTKSIGLEAFWGCEDLTTVKILATEVPTLGEGAFDNCANTLKILVPEGSEDAYKIADFWIDYAEKIGFCTIDDILSTVEGGFPTTEANAWVNEYSLKAYLDNETLYIGNVNLPVNTLLTKDESDYIYSCFMYDVKFVMTQATLTSIEVSRVISGTANGIFKAVMKIEKPTADETNFLYDGQQKTYTLATNDAYTVSGNIQTEVGKYTVKVSLKNAQYKWADGTTNDLSFDFIINQRVADLIKKDDQGQQVDNPVVSIIGAEKGIAPDAVLVVKVMNIEKSEDTEAVEGLLKDFDKIAENEKIYGLYDAKLVVNDVEIQPNGTITIKMLVPEELRDKEFKLYHIHNGSEVIEITYSDIDGDGFITFTTDKLSEFAFVGEVPYETTGLSAGAIAGIVIGSVVGAILITYIVMFIVWKKKGKALKFLIPSYTWIDSKIFKK